MINSAMAKSPTISDMAKAYTDYDMILKYTSIPRLADQRGVLLRAFLNSNANYQVELSELIVLATTLVQTGLDIHDGIDNDSVGEVASFEERQRQIRVLAGDYFSARFYQLLAKAGRVDVIHALTNAICEINRLKLDLYNDQQKRALTSIEHFERQVHIRMQLYLCFTPTHWTDILEHVTKCEWIVEHIDAGWLTEEERNSFLALFDSEWDIVKAKSRLPHIQIISEEVHSIGSQLKQHLLHSLKRD